MIKQGMRDNVLQGIRDVGFRIEKNVLGDGRLETGARRLNRNSEPRIRINFETRNPS